MRHGYILAAMLLSAGARAQNINCVAACKPLSPADQQRIDANARALAGDASSGTPCFTVEGAPCLKPGQIVEGSHSGGVKSCETIRGDMVCGSEDELAQIRKAYNVGTPSTSTYKSTTVPIPSEGTLYVNAPHPSYCDPGWTLVQVGSASLPTSNPMKCAPVGDLRDPK